MITIPDEILNDGRLNHTEILLLSIYHNYTLYGKEHCCILTNTKLGDMLHIQNRQVRRYKQHLKELGLIEANGGIKVWYKREGVNDPHNSDNKEGGRKCPTKEGVNDQREGVNDPLREGVNDPHNLNNNLKQNLKELKEDSFSFEDSLVDGMDYNNKNI